MWTPLPVLLLMALDASWFPVAPTPKIITPLLPLAEMLFGPRGAHQRVRDAIEAQAYTRVVVDDVAVDRVAVAVVVLGSDVAASTEAPLVSAERDPGKPACCT